MKKSEKFFKRLASLFTALVFCCGAAVGYYHYTLPDDYRVTAGSSLRLDR
ncbi:MAG TPA: SpoIVB peptidase, partial [Ruminococcaceae bacterium]|nr:SpoIVB peptidase [Oscillospiraceae bacterium]